MIRLKTAKGELDLSPKTVIPWRQINPFFEENEEFTAQLSLPFSLPLTPNNQYLLSFAENLQVTSYIKAIPIIMYVEGILFFRGQLNILKPGTGGYDVSISFDKSIVNTDKNIRDFNYGGPRTGEADAVKRTSANSKFYPFTDYVWPEVKNLEEKKNESYSGSAFTINHFHNATMAYNNKELITLMPFLNYVVKQIFHELGGITANGSFFDLVQDKIIYNPVVCNTMVGESIKISTRWDYKKHQFDNLWKEMEVRISDVSTSYNVAVGGVLSMDFYEYPSGSMTPITPRTLTYTITLADVGNPQVLLQNLWATIQTISGAFVLRDQNWADPNNPWFIFANASREDFFENARTYDIGINYAPTGTYLYNHPQIGKHLPSLKVRDFFNAIKDACNLTLFYNTSKQLITFTPRKLQLATSKVKDFTSKLIHDYQKELLETSLYRFVFENDKSDSNTSDESTWFATANSEYNALGYVEYRIPLATPKVGSLNQWAEVKQALSKYSDTTTPEFTLRLLTWQGMVNVLGISYPQANSEGLTPNEMYDTWFKDWYRATKLGRELTDMDIALTVNDIVNFDPEEKWKVLHNNYVWKSIETPITMQGIGISRARLMRIPANGNVYNTPSGDALPPE